VTSRSIDQAHLNPSLFRPERNNHHHLHPLNLLPHMRDDHNHIISPFHLHPIVSRESIEFETKIPEEIEIETNHPLWTVTSIHPPLGPYSIDPPPLNDPTSEQSTTQVLNSVIHPLRTSIEQNQCQLAKDSEICY
jgi:hypothetical protein